MKVGFVRKRRMLEVFKRIKILSFEKADEEVESKKINYLKKSYS
jgi:hypothetical protein